MSLSVCIPTCNRAAALDRLLACLHSQHKMLAGKVEFCISDNCSNDGTPDVVKKWTARMPLRYNRNKSNLGYDRNVIAAIRLANGRYTWIMGDDDLVLPGSLSALADAVELAGKNGVGAVYVNFLVGKNPAGRLGFPSIRFFSAGSKDCPFLNVSFGGAVCLDRNTACAIIKNKIRQSGTGISKTGRFPHALDDFAHSYLFLECAAHSGRIGVFPAPCVQIVADGESTSYERKLYLDIILMMYSLEARQAYPWFHDGAKNYNSKAMLVRAALSTLRPRLSEPYRTSIALHKKLLAQDGNRLEGAIISAIDLAFRIPLAKSFLACSFLAIKRACGRTKINDAEDNSDYMKQRLAFAVSRAKKLLA